MSRVFVITHRETGVQYGPPFYTSLGALEYAMTWHEKELSAGTISITGL